MTASEPDAKEGHPLTVAMYKRAVAAACQAGLAIREAGWFGNKTTGAAWVSIGYRDWNSRDLVSHMLFSEDFFCDFEDGRCIICAEFGIEFSDNLADQEAQCRAFIAVLKERGVDCILHSKANP